MQRGALPMKIALVDDDPRALAQLEQYLTEQLVYKV